MDSSNYFLCNYFDILLIILAPIKLFLVPYRNLLSILQKPSKHIEIKSHTLIILLNSPFTVLIFLECTLIKSFQKYYTSLLSLLIYIKFFIIKLKNILPMIHSSFQFIIYIIKFNSSITKGTINGTKIHFYVIVLFFASFFI